MGLAVTVAFFVGVELLLRAVYGLPESPRFLRPHWLAKGRFFEINGDVAQATYQGIDTIGSFPTKPTPGTARVIGFGESSMRGGSALPPALEFMGLIETALDKAGVPAVSLNLGRSGMDTSTLPRLVYEGMALEPDVVVFYFGHNDIANSTLERRYGDISGALEARLTVLLERTQLYLQLQRRISARPQLNPMVTRGPLVMSPEQTAMAEATFERNLRRAVQLCQDADAEVVLITPGSANDRWFATEPVCPDALPEKAWARKGAGYALQLNQISPADVEAAHASAPDCPEIEYLWGLLMLRRGQRAEAWAQLALARDHDPAPMRATSGIVEAVREVSRSMDTGLVDFELALRERDSLEGLFIDNVHLDRQTHALVARLATPVVQERIQRRAQGRR